MKPGAIKKKKKKKSEKENKLVQLHGIRGIVAKSLSPSIRC